MSHEYTHEYSVPSGRGVGTPAKHDKRAFYLMLRANVMGRGIGIGDPPTSYDHQTSGKCRNRRTGAVREALARSW